MTMNGGWAFQNAGLWQRGRRTASARASAAAPAQPLVYQITETTQLLLQRGDITLFEGDAIVNAGACTSCVMHTTSYKSHSLPCSNICYKSHLPCGALCFACRLPGDFHRTSRAETVGFVLQQTSDCWAAAAWTARSIGRQGRGCEMRAGRCQRWSRTCAARPARPA